MNATRGRFLAFGSIAGLENLSFVEITPYDYIEER